MNCLFSVIIPTYNRADQLKKSLDSLANQTCRDFEVLVCDDGSTDETRQVVHDYSGLSIRYLYGPNWGGPAQPRNRGLAEATSDWVCFLDSDDTWYPTKLERCLPHLDKYDLIYHDLDIVDGSGIKGRLKSRRLNGDAFRDLLTGGNTVSTSSVCARKDKVMKAGGFSEDKSIIALEDFDLWLNMARGGSRFFHLPKSLGTYWSGGGNITESSSRQIERIRAVYARHMNRDPILLREAGGMLSYCVARIYFNMGEFDKARAMYLHALLKTRNLVAMKSLAGAFRAMGAAYLQK